VNLCLLLGSKQILYATTAFTLAWTHSVEKTRWEEDWTLRPSGLTLDEARIEGSGAGMEPPADATFDGRFWHYHPHLPPQSRIVLARSGATVGDWDICFDGTCHDVPDAAVKTEDPAILEPCP
jgi:hypothetical protein